VGESEKFGDMVMVCPQSLLARDSVGEGIVFRIMAISGVIFMGTGIILAVVGKSKKKKAVMLYNKHLEEKKRSFSFKLDATEHGVGLVWKIK
jgi:preprotein translocase subunit SecG